MAHIKLTTLQADHVEQINKHGNLYKNINGSYCFVNTQTQCLFTNTVNQLIKKGLLIRTEKTDCEEYKLQVII